MNNSEKFLEEDGKISNLIDSFVDQFNWIINERKLLERTSSIHFFFFFSASL